MAYHRYFAIIVRLEYPSAFNVPICVRCSSTMRVMVVKQTSAATRIKNNGNTEAIASTFSASS